MNSFREKKILDSIQQEIGDFHKENSNNLSNDSDWAFYPVPNELELKGKFFTAGVFIGDDYCILTVMDKVGNGKRNPKLPGGMTQDVIFHDNSYFAALRAALENCKIFKKKEVEEIEEWEEAGRVYSEPVILQIIEREKRRDNMNDKHKISKRNIVLEFIEEVGYYPVGMELCWYQHQKIKNWHRFFFWVKKIFTEKNGGLVECKNFKPIEGFRSVDREIAFSLPLKFDQALKDQTKENSQEVLFPPHQSALRTAGSIKAVEDREFAFSCGYLCFSPYPYWDKKNPPK